ERMILVFFFSSRRRHTSLQGDWSSDVALPILTSSAVSMVRTAIEDARKALGIAVRTMETADEVINRLAESPISTPALREYVETRSEERRVGKECRYVLWHSE